MNNKGHILKMQLSKRISKRKHEKDSTSFESKYSFRSFSLKKDLKRKISARKGQIKRHIKTLLT